MKVMKLLPDSYFGNLSSLCNHEPVLGSFNLTLTILGVLRCKFKTFTAFHKIDITLP